MPEIGLFRCRKALISTKNVLYSQKMSKTTASEPLPLGSIIFRVLPRNRQRGRENPQKKAWVENRPRGRRAPPPQPGGPRRPQPAYAGGHRRLLAQRRDEGPPWPRHPSGASRTKELLPA